jgi:hypothetical protein
MLQRREQRRVTTAAQKAVTRLLLDISLHDVPQEDRYCGICREPYLGCESPEHLDTYGPGEEPVQLPCGHRFGKSCISAWLLEQKICALCRCDFSLRQESPINAGSDDGDFDDDFDINQDEDFSEDQQEEEEEEEEEEEQDGGLINAPFDMNEFPLWLVSEDDEDDWEPAGWHLLNLDFQ